MSDIQYNIVSLASLKKDTIFEIHNPKYYQTSPQSTCVCWPNYSSDIIHSCIVNVISKPIAFLILHIKWNNRFYRVLLGFVDP